MKNLFSILIGAAIVLMVSLSGCNGATKSNDNETPFSTASDGGVFSDAGCV